MPLYVTIFLNILIGKFVGFLEIQRIDLLDFAVRLEADRSRFLSSVLRQVAE